MHAEWPPNSAAGLSLRPERVGTWHPARVRRIFAIALGPNALPTRLAEGERGERLYGTVADAADDAVLIVSETTGSAGVNVITLLPRRVRARAI